MRKALPNLITLSRLPLVALTAFLLYGAADPARARVALLLFVIAALTDLVDGFLARRLNAVSEFGRISDTTLDKLLIAVPLITLGMAQPLQPVAHVCILLIAARELLLSGLREGLAGAGHSAAIPTSIIGKIKMHAQALAVTALIMTFAFPAAPGLQPFMLVSLLLATLVTWVSGGDYILRAVRIMTGKSRA